MRYHTHLGLFILAALLLAACAGPRNLPVSPTPIPTLVPATEPATLPGAAATQSFTILSYPAQSPSAMRGQPLYQTHCASCHGEDGQGVVPGARNFNDLDYMRGENPAFFYEAVSEGRGDMPSFQDKLSSDERWDVVFYVWRFSTNADNLALGKNIYEANCAACHGEDGTGKVLGAADFTDLRLVDDRAPRDFYLTVTQGKGSMPAWQGRLSQDERWAVIDYLRTFSYDPTLPEDTLAETVPEVTPTEAGCPSGDTSQSNPFAWDDSNAATAGQIIYTQNCSMCHGVDGSGGLPGAPDFTTAEFNADLHQNAVELFCIVAEGINSMPAWNKTLSVEQMWQVLTYIGTFGN